MDWRIEVKTAMARKGIAQREVAEALGCYDSTISRGLAGKYADFKTVFMLTKHLLGEEWTAVMDEYCLTLSRKLSVISAFEYAYSNDRYELTKKLIERHKDQKGTLKDCVDVYKVMYDHKTALSNGGDEKKLYVDSLEKFRLLYGHVTEPVLNARVFLFLGLLHFRHKALGVIPTYRDSFISKLEILSDSYIKDSLFSQYHTLESAYCLYSDADAEKSVYHADAILKNYTSSLFRRGSAMHAKGWAELYRDKEKSMKCFKESAMQYRYGGYHKIADEREGENVHFVKNVHKEKIDDDKLEGEELAHQLIVRGKHEEALKLLEVIDDGKSPYVKLYKGMAKRSIREIMDAHGLFLLQGYTFLLELCRRELENLVLGETSCQS